MSVRPQAQRGKGQHVAVTHGFQCPGYYIDHSPLGTRSGHQSDTTGFDFLTFYISVSGATG